MSSDKCLAQSKHFLNIIYLLLLSMILGENGKKKKIFQTEGAAVPKTGGHVGEPQMICFGCGQGAEQSTGKSVQGWSTSSVKASLPKDRWAWDGSGPGAMEGSENTGKLPQLCTLAWSFVWLTWVIKSHLE